MRAGTLDVTIGDKVNANLKWLASKDNAKYGDAKPLIDARQITMNSTPPAEESALETARWLAHLLHGTVRAAASPPAGTKPEHAAAVRAEIEKMLGRPVSDAELQEALNDPRWRHVHDAMLAAVEGREPRPLPPPSPSHAAARAPVEDAEVIAPTPDTSNPWRTGVARFDPRSGRLVPADDPEVVNLASGTSKVVLLPGGVRTAFVNGEADVEIEARLAGWYGAQAGAQR
jgi:hypothetical protein